MILNKLISEDVGELQSNNSCIWEEKGRIYC